MENNSSLLKRLWEGWKRIAVKIAHVQGHLVLSLIYGLVVTPLAVLFRLFRQDPLHLKENASPSYWTRRPPVQSVSEFLRKEF